MSPEQVAGQRDLDARSDVYSLACVTYEMLAGDPPFIASKAQAVMAKHVTDPAPPITTPRPSVSPAIAHALTKALHKTPVDRYESAGAFATGLTEDDQAPEGKSVVVLPFVNRSPDPDNEYFGDGLTDEVISDLSGVSALRVISRNSSMALKGTTKDTPTLARELGVTHLVTGTVRRAGTALRVTADLVEASTDRPIWSQKFSGTMEDVFGIQEEISRQIVSALKVRLTDTEKREVAERPIDDPVAYDCYLRAHQVMYNWTLEDQHRALRLVDDAIDIVGDSALLLATKGQIHWSQVNMFVAPAEEGLARASELVSRATALDPNHHVAIYVRGLVAGMRGQPEAALVDLYRAHGLRPGDANVLGELGRYSHSSGLRRVRKYVDQLLRIDPLTPITHLNTAVHYWLIGPVEELAAHARHAIALAPDVSILHVYAGWALAEAGCSEEAAEILGRVGRALTGNMHGALALFLMHALGGDEEGALRIATPEMKKTVQNEMAARMMAAGSAILGRTHDAIRWLRAAVELGFINYPNLSADAAVFESLRGEPEFQALMAGEAVVDWEQGLTA
jgi:TolB-like protein